MRKIPENKRESGHFDEIVDTVIIPQNKKANEFLKSKGIQEIDWQIK